MKIIRKIRKNKIQKKKLNFERTLFDQTTSSRLSFGWYPTHNSTGTATKKEDFI
jgi:hypothetical protein